MFERDIAEFVESIPFTKTRDYVQAILRNAQVYRQLYPPEAPPAASVAGTKAPEQYRGRIEERLGLSRRSRGSEISYF